jgi:hypothetical protein
MMRVLFHSKSQGAQLNIIDYKLDARFRNYSRFELAIPNANHWMHSLGIVKNYFSSREHTGELCIIVGDC